jgi:hypothetical protein
LSFYIYLTSDHNWRLSFDSFDSLTLNLKSYHLFAESTADMSEQLFVPREEMHFMYLVAHIMVVRNQNLIQGEIKRRLNSSNACYHSVQNLLSSRLLSKKVKIRI